MAFKKVQAVAKYFKYKDCTPGQMLVDNGTYHGIIQGKFGIEHKFIQKNGDVVVLNSAGHLNWLLENYTQPGDAVNVFYKECHLLEKGKFAGKDCHYFEIEVDDEKYSQPSPTATLPDVPAEFGEISL